MILLNRLFESRDTVGRSSHPLPDVGSHIVRLCALWVLSSWVEGEEADPRCCPPVWCPADTVHVTHMYFKTQVPTERDLLPFLNQEVENEEDLVPRDHSYTIPTFTYEDSPGKPHLIHLRLISLVSIAKLVPQHNYIGL